MRTPPQALMMFAAGFGTRMKHLTRTLPKPMIQVAGTPLIDHALAIARDAECGPIVANLHYKPETLQAHLDQQNVVTILELPEILETGGGLRNALPHLGPDPVFTMNADAIWSGANPLNLLADAWEPDRMDALLMTVPIAKAVGYEGNGDFSISADGQLCRGPGFVYGGVQIIKTDRLDAIPEQKFSLNILWDQMQRDARLFGLKYPGYWCDVGHPGGIDLAEKLLKEPNV